MNYYAVATNYLLCGHELLFRGHELLMCGHKLLFRGHELLMCGHELLLRGHKLINIHPCHQRGTVDLEVNMNQNLKYKFSGNSAGFLYQRDERSSD